MFFEPCFDLRTFKEKQLDYPLIFHLWCVFVYSSFKVVTWLDLFLKI